MTREEEPLRTRLNTVVVAKDGWVYVLTRDQQIGLGDIDVDCQIVDLRTGKRSELKEKARKLLKSGMKYVDISKELGVSRPTLYSWFGKPKKVK